MNEDRQEEIGALLAPMLKKVLFVALSKAVATSDRMLPHVAEHLRYMNDLEERGILFASGPFVQEGVLVGDGLTILRAESLDHARQLMEEEPLIKLGMRTFELRKWELREGRISISLNASRSSFDLG
ncbi:MAG: YciI family protein [Paraburkholderia sp.]